MTLEAGKLTERITIRAKIESNTPLGRKQAYTDIATVWAQVAPLSFYSRYAAGADRAEVLTVFRIRYRTDVKRHMQLVHEGTEYRIIGVSPIGNKEGLEIRAESVE